MAAAVFLASVAIFAVFVIDFCAGSVQFKVDVLFKPSECKRPSKYGDQVFVHFNGTKFDTGVLFDNSHPDKPYRFQLGVGDVIDGFEEGLIDMCPGEKRRLIVPPHMAYGMDGGGTPYTPGGTVIFDVELVHAEQGPRHPDVFREIDLDSDRHITKFELAHYLRKEMEDTGTEAMSQAEEMGIVNDIFQLEDIDKDGFISIWEFSGNKHDEF